MHRRLPPLNALKSFEAAARHLSFTKAADELFVTQAAVSHQIKALEDFLSMKLFLRRNRTLLLTEEGQAKWYERDSPSLIVLCEILQPYRLQRSEKDVVEIAYHVDYIKSQSTQSSH